MITTESELKGPTEMAKLKILIQTTWESHIFLVSDRYS